MIYNSDYLISRLSNKHADVKSEQDLLSRLTQSKTEECNTNTDSVIKQEEMLEAFSDLRGKLATHMGLDKVLFLFGNGVSIYAGSKDTRDFKLEDYKGTHPNLNNVLDKVGNICGIEEQLNALISIQSYYRLVDEIDNEKDVDNLITDIKKKLIDTFVNSVDYRNLNLHEIFLLKLRSSENIYRTSIYTLNYDLAFEYVMDSLGINYENGFSGFVNRIFDPRTLQRKERTSLVKIHGSVNWIMEDGTTIKEIQPKYENGRVKVDDAKPVLIYPTSNKLYQTYSTPYSELMRHMLDEMRTEKNVVIIMGYKYGDEHINDILFKALENPGNTFYFFVYNPDESNEFISRITRLSDGMQNINILLGKPFADFQYFVKYILPGLSEKNDQEKVLELLQKGLVPNAKR